MVNRLRRGLPRRSVLGGILVLERHMDSAYLSAFSALAGAMIGGVTTFLSSWTTQTAQIRSARLTEERSRRDDLYSKFLEETARLYSYAMSEDKINHDKLVNIFALRGRILLQSSPSTVEAADAIIKRLVSIYMKPNRTDEDLLRDLENTSDDLMVDFAKVCRAELRLLN